MQKLKEGPVLEARYPTCARWYLMGLVRTKIKIGFKSDLDYPILFPVHYFELAIYGIMAEHYPKQAVTLVTTVA